eukprot:m51a1_g8309 putative adenylate guanylate cyclase (709) ;mRNA; r:72736-74915
MRVSFRAILVATVCAAVWVPMIVVVVLFNARTRSILMASTEERLPPYVVRLGGTVLKSLESAESVAEQTSADLSSGFLTFVDTPLGLRGLRQRWHNVLQAYNSTSDVQFVTSENTESPGRMVGLVEFSSGENLWWWTWDNGTLGQWAIDIETLEPAELQWTYEGFSEYYLPFVRGSVPPGSDVCWMPIYTQVGQVWTSFVSKAFFSNTSGADRPVWAYVVVDLVIADIAKVFAGLTVSNGVAVLVESQSSTLLGSTSSTIQAYRTEGDSVLPVLVNETSGTSVDERRAAAVNAFVERVYGSWDALSHRLDPDYDKPTPPAVITIDGETTLVSFTLVTRPCLSWVVAVVAVEESVSTDITPIIVAVATTVAALVALAVLSILLTRPLNRLSYKMDAAARLKFKKQQADLSHFSEFQKLNDSFRKLSTGIEAMTKFVPMPVVSQIMANSMAKEGHLLSVSMKRVTIMFCDIRGFTMLSEKLKTKVVVQMLFEWLGAFTKVIVRNGGIVDKYIGDCIMALWNAPLETDNPEAKACSTALEFEKVLKELNEGFEQEGLPGLNARVGIHTGELFVGNIGCEDHINYTVCGTPANIAARVEQLGKVYGLTPLVSGDVAKCVADQFVCVWVDELKLRGHENTVTKVYHLAARANEAMPSQLYAAQLMSTIETLAEERKGDAEVMQCIQDAVGDDGRMSEYHQVLSLHLDRLRSGR